MCDSEGSGGSTSVAIEEEARRAWVRPEVEVFVVSDGGSSPTPSARKRLLFGIDKERQRSPGYKLRAKVPGTDRFNPFKQTEAEIARKKLRILDKRRRELEDDAGSPLKLEEYSRGVSAFQESNRATSPAAACPRLSSGRGELKLSRKEHFKVFDKKKSVSNGSSCRKRVQDKLHKLNESLRRTVSVPGTGKKTRRISGSDRSRVLVSAPACAPAPAPAAPAPSCKVGNIHKAFDKLWDEATLNKLRGDFTLPSVMRRESKTAVGPEESDDDSSPCLVAVTGTSAGNAGENEFSVKLNAELRKPFSMDELESKMRSARRQKPVVKSRDLRGQRCVDFTTEQEGLSYLDYHPGLASALRLECDPEEKLRLLRGFFFWVEHACMEGSFRPWDSKQADKQAVIVIDD